MKQIKFDSFVGKLLKEEPQVAPAPVKPTTKPSAPPKPNRPVTPNPDPFRRHKPGQMPKIAPKAGSDLKQAVQNIIGKYSKFIGG
jgi:hypothetical protein